MAMHNEYYTWCNVRTRHLTQCSTLFCLIYVADSNRAAWSQFQNAFCSEHDFYYLYERLHRFKMIITMIQEV